MEQIATCLQIQVTKFGTTPTNLAHKIYFFYLLWQAK